MFTPIEPERLRKWSLWLLLWALIVLALVWYWVLH